MKDASILPVLMAIASLVGGGTAMVGWAYGNFETKESSRERMEQIEKRLERIEAKLDRLSETVARSQREGN